jgi:hypothetical protein
MESERRNRMSSRLRYIRRAWWRIRRALRLAKYQQQCHRNIALEQILELYAEKNEIVEVVCDKTIAKEYGYTWRVWLVDNDQPGFGYTLFEAFHEAERHLTDDERIRYRSDEGKRGE